MTLTSGVDGTSLVPIYPKSTGASTGTESMTTSEGGEVTETVMLTAVVTETVCADE